ncbi:MAG: hypothetical protein M5U21_00075 [Fimbriimonadaceae bacterium]|nr:hypothetical protein [Fimbriimonadaceae bacterium]
MTWTIKGSDSIFAATSWRVPDLAESSSKADFRLLARKVKVIWGSAGRPRTPGAGSVEA